jgi:hypothetical protein
VNSKINIGLFLSVTLIFGGLFINATSSRSNNLHFSAYVIQDGKQLPIDQHIVRAKKSPFQIVIEMNDGRGVFVSSSLKSSTYNQAIRNVSPEKLNGFKDMANYELWKNPLNELLIEGSGPNFWFIDSPSKHRFSFYEKVNGKFICTRQVDYLYDLKKHEVIPLASISKPLYFTFIMFASKEEDYRHVELMRHGFKIEWE